MARHHATKNGPVPFTEAEESDADAMEIDHQANARIIMIKSLAASVQRLLDETALSKCLWRGMCDNLTAPSISIATYDNDHNPQFAAEAATFKAWRSAVWTHFYRVIDDVNAGTRQMPTKSELLAELPDIVW